MQHDLLPAPIGKNVRWLLSLMVFTCAQHWFLSAPLPCDLFAFHPFCLAHVHLLFFSLGSRLFSRNIDVNFDVKHYVTVYVFQYVVYYVTLYVRQYFFRPEQTSRFTVLPWFIQSSLTTIASLLLLQMRPNSGHVSSSSTRLRLWRKIQILCANQVESFLFFVVLSTSAARPSSVRKSVAVLASSPSKRNGLCSTID